MRTIGIILFLLAGFCRAEDRINIAVLELKAISITAADAQTVTEELRSQLVKLERFNVLERERMADILKEHGFQQTGVCEDAECYAKIGKMMGVQQMVAGSIGKMGGLYVLNIRLIDVNTGKTMDAMSAKYSGTIEDILLKLVPNVVRRLNGENVEILTGEKPPFYKNPWYRYGMLSAGAAAAVVSAIMYKKGNDIYQKDYQDAVGHTQEQEYWDQVQGYNGKGHLLLGIAGVLFIGGGISFVF